MKVLQETKKEDGLLFNGVFWIIADSFEDILTNKYKLIGNKYLVDINGNEVNPTSKNSKTHQQVWNKEYKDQYTKEYTYYPRGRVNIYNNHVYINLNSKLLINPNIINSIYSFYRLSKFDATDITISPIDELQGAHYNFELT